MFLGGELSADWDCLEAGYCQQVRFDPTLLAA